jgi:hypothetical protein
MDYSKTLYKSIQYMLNLTIIKITYIQAYFLNGNPVFLKTETIDYKQNINPPP